MTVRTVSEVVSFAQRIYARLARGARKSLAGPYSHPGAEPLLIYIANHDRAFSRTLARYQKDISAGVLGTYVRWLSRHSFARLEQLSRVDFSADPDRIIQQLLAVDAEMADILATCAHGPGVPRVQEVFEDLLRERKARLASFTANLHDLDLGWAEKT